jgi:hypothetical protein
MPGKSGMELGWEIRQRYSSLPVVLTSGYSHVLAEEVRRRFELLHQPYAVEDVSRVLRRVTHRNDASWPYPVRLVGPTSSTAVSVAVRLRSIYRCALARRNVRKWHVPEVGRTSVLRP